MSLVDNCFFRIAALAVYMYNVDNNNNNNNNNKLIPRAHWNGYHLLNYFRLALA